MKVAHLAAFQGNVGDIVNHCSFQRMFAAKVDKDAQFDPVEMRHFYFNASRRKFDEAFVQKVNEYDLLVVGGGCFFDLRWPESATGTTLNIPPSLWDKINIPVLVNAMGYQEYGHALTEECKDKFLHFLRFMVQHPNWLVTLRNDRSAERIAERFGKEYITSLVEVPDNGFFFQSPLKPYTFVDRKPTIGMCITSDLFLESFNQGLTVEVFFDKMASLISSLAAEGFRIFLFLHTPQDVDGIQQIIKRTGQALFRSQVLIAPYDASGQQGADVLDSYYRACDYMISMRFHASILAVKNRVPVIGLAGHARIQALFQELGISANCVVANSDKYADEVLAQLQMIRDNEAACRTQYDDLMHALEKRQKQYMNTISTFLSRQKLL